MTSARDSLVSSHSRRISLDIATATLSCPILSCWTISRKFKIRRISSSPLNSSATHKTQHNCIYAMDALDAYKQKLFNNLFTSNVRYHKVDNYQTLLDIMKSMD